MRQISEFLSQRLHVKREDMRLWNFKVTVVQLFRCLCQTLPTLATLINSKQNQPNHIHKQFYTLTHCISCCFESFMASTNILSICASRTSTRCRCWTTTVRAWRTRASWTTTPSWWRSARETAPGRRRSPPSQPPQTTVTLVDFLQGFSTVFVS